MVSFAADSGGVMARRDATRHSRGKRGKPASSASKAIKIAVVIAALAGIAWGVHVMVNRRPVVAAYNRIVEKELNQGRYREAAEKLETLRDDAWPELERKIDRDLAMCYVAIGEDPSLPLAESAEWYRKAERLAPDRLEEEHRKVLDLFDGGQ
jgi:tetratricopeptide (TPR) repeat protein